jgi:hypothetical protein
MRSCVTIVSSSGGFGKSRLSKLGLALPGTRCCPTGTFDFELNRPPDEHISSKLWRPYTLHGVWQPSESPGNPVSLLLAEITVAPAEKRGPQLTGIESWSVWDAIREFREGCMDCSDSFDYMEMRVEAQNDHRMDPLLHDSKLLGEIEEVNRQLAQSLTAAVLAKLRRAAVLGGSGWLVGCSLSLLTAGQTSNRHQANRVEKRDE